MRLPRITLPWRAFRRNTDPVSRRARRSRRPGAHRAATTFPLPGRRTAVGGAMTILALTATTATAVDAPADGGTTGPVASSSAVGTATTSAADAVDPLVVVSSDPTVVKATEALERADDAAAHDSADAEKIAKRAAKVTELLTDQVAARPAAAASRSADRDAVVPADETEKESDEQPEDATGTEETVGAEKESEAAEDVAASETASIVEDNPRLIEADPLPDPAAVFPAEGTGDDDAGDTTSTAAGAVVAAGTASATVPADPKKLARATKSLDALVDKLSDESVEVKAAPEKPKPRTPGQILRAQVAAAKKAAPKLARFADSTEGDANGRISSSALSTLKFDAKEQLRADAARQLERLNVAYKARFGTSLTINDTYRSYEAQVAVKASRGHMAATPGYSNHGWGVAVDLGGGVESFGTAQYEWMRENAAKFGWKNPAWAQADGRKPEAWHWEYSPLT